VSDDLNQLLNNEREWRKYMIERMEEYRREIAHIKAWNLVFRMAGGAILSLLYLWVDHKFK
jgi:hypothetical protein